MQCKSINSALFYICNLARQNSLSAANYETIYATTNPEAKESFSEKIKRAERIKVQIEKLCSPLEHAILNFYYGFTDKFDDNAALDVLAAYIIIGKKYHENTEAGKIIIRAWRDSLVRYDLELVTALTISARHARRTLASEKDILESYRLKFYYDDYVLASEIAPILICEGFLSKNYI
jgi:hypothetical protein